MQRLKPHNRAGYWALVRRVPKEFSHLDRRSFARISTGIRVADDPRGVRASAVLPYLNADLERHWQDLAAGVKSGSVRSHVAVQRRAQRLGLTYMPAAAVAAEPLSEVMQRLELLERLGTVDDPEEVAVVLGGVEPPNLMLSDIAAEYEDIQRASLVGMSDDQLRIWRNVKDRAVEHLVRIVGDKPARDLTRADALKFRNHWQDRVVEGKVKIATANKSIGQAAKMLRVVEDAKQVGIPPVFRLLRIEGGEEGHRAAFEPQFVQNIILAENALSDLNEEARRIIYVCADTGLRPAEICNLTAETIRLDAEVPHVLVRADGRKLKTAQSEREMPLVGCALAAMKLQRRGFPRYRDRSSALSALLNQFLSRRGMRPTTDHTVYSLRHTFEDRLTAIEVPEKIIASLMGHKFQRPKYGAGPSLKQRQEWLSRIAFRPPTSL